MSTATPAHPTGHHFPHPSHVRLGQVAQWLSAGWRNFLANPGVWVAQTLILIVVLFVCGLIPHVGGALVLIAFPILVGGLLSGVDALQQGRQLTVALLFDGLRRHRGNLLVVGLFYLLGGKTAQWIAILVGSSHITTLLSGTGLESSAASMLVASVVFSVLWSILIMALSFAPALVLFSDTPPLDAMSLSVRGCLRNLLACAAMALIVCVLGWLAMVPAGLGMLILVPILAGALYHAYRDVFCALAAPAVGKD